MVRIGKYTSAPQQCQFSITFKQGNTADVRSLLQFSFLIKYVYTVRSYYEQDQVNDKWCRKKKGNAEIQFSVFVSITRIIDLLFWHFFATLFLSVSAISEAQKTEPPPIMGQEIINTFDLCSWRGQKSAQF